MKMESMDEPKWNPETEGEITDLTKKIIEFTAQHKDDLETQMMSYLRFVVQKADAKVDREATKEELKALWDHLRMAEPN